MILSVSPDSHCESSKPPCSDNLVNANCSFVQIRKWISEFEDLEFKNWEFENSEFENLLFENLQFENSEFKTSEFEHLWLDIAILMKTKSTVFDFDFD